MRKVFASLGREDWALCVSQSTKNDLCEHFRIDGSRAFVTPLAAAPEIFHPCTDSDWICAVRWKYGIPAAPYYLSLNTLEPRKNMRHAITSFARLLREQNLPDLNYVLVGAKGWGYEPILKAIEEAGSIGERIICVGYVDEEDLAPLYSGALGFVYPSLYEGFGLPPLEAMQCGVPVITSNTSSLPEVVGNAGIMVDPYDEDELSQSMWEIYRNAPLRAQMQAKSIARAAEFSWDRCIAETVAAYRTALAC
jgi:glycosyltransferase involved in cell wall biosynthesis